LEVRHVDELVPGFVAPFVLAAVLLVDRLVALLRVVEVTVEEVVVAGLERIEKPVALRISVERDPRVVVVAPPHRPHLLGRARIASSTSGGTGSTMTVRLSPSPLNLISARFSMPCEPPDAWN